jgi:outer membrane protein, multidrug efflux system
VAAWSTTAGAAVLALSGCLNLAPRYYRPPAPISREYPADAPSVSGAALDSTADWHQVFTNPDLVRVIEQALQSSRDLKTAVLRVEEARALRGIQRADLFPDIAVAGSYTRTRTPADLSLVGFSTLTSAYQVIVGLSSWELDFWGRLRNLDTAAIESYLATDASRRAFTVSLVGQVADAWLTQRELDSRLEVARRTTASRQETLRIARRREEEGASTRFELAQVETLVTQAQVLTAQLEQSRATNSHALTLLVGSPVEMPPQPEALQGQSEPVHAVAAGLPSDLLERRPDILAAEHQLRAAHANIGAARAAFFPQVSLTGDFGTASTDLNRLFDSGTRVWSFSPQIALPIFTGGRLRSNLDLATVRRNLAVASYELAIQSAFRDVADAMSTIRWLSEQASVQRAALAAQTERTRLAKTRYQRGASAYLEVLEAERDLLDTEQALIQVERAVQSGRVALFMAIGGGALGAGG